MPPIDKTKLWSLLVSALTEARDRVLAAQRTSVEGVTHEDAKSESDKDMRATEASYVARGQAMRVEALEADLAKVAGMRPRAFSPDAPIALGALVTVATEEGERVVLLAPAGGGLRLAIGATAVQVVTPVSPIGRALLGATQGDVVAFAREGAEEELEVVAIA
jgi:transcription elongation GreA/GreB family factor